MSDSPPDSRKPPAPQVMTLLSEVMALDPARRWEHIDRVCAGNPLLKEELLSLLAGAERSKQTPPTAGVKTVTLPPGAGHPQVPERVGPYKVIQEIDHGGMGEVYLAEQDPPLQRLVAVKLIRHDLNAAVFIARFESERRTLALMNHDHIAKVFGTGATAEGLPYIAMEYVPGMPVDKYCSCHTLGLRDRLDLFCDICRAVQHAHSKGVMHRDLKPSNVLVTTQDGRPIPKIIDFGIAKAVDPRLDDRPLATVRGQAIGTPEFMSPEQTRTDDPDIDTRTDVYSLGMILYSLLAGEPPFDFAALRKAGGKDAVFRVIRESDVPLPSRKISERQAGEGQVASRFAAAASAVEISGDLDWITLKCLEKDRNRRYATPLDIAADIQRFLHDEPVSVGPPSMTYRTGKFIRKYRIQVAAAGLVGLAVLAGLMATGIALSRAVRAESVARDAAARAVQEATTANTVIDLLVGLFESHDPGLARGKPIDAREFLQRGTERTLHLLEAQPLVQARMMGVLGLVDSNLGQYEEARKLLSESLQLRRKLLAPDAALADTLDMLGHLEMETKHPEAALRVYEEALAIREKKLNPDDPRVCSSLNNVGVALRELGRPADARPFLEKALERRERTLSNDIHIAESHMNLADVLSDLESNEEALKHYTRALEDYDRLDPDSPDRALVLDNLGVLKATSEGYAAALPLHQQALEIRRRVLPPRHPDIAMSLVNTGNDLLELKDYPEAQEHYLEAIEIYEAFPELSPRSLAWVQGNLAALYVATRRFSESDKSLSRARELLVSLDGPASADLADILEYLAGSLQEGGHKARADMAAAEARAIRERLQVSDSH